MTAERALNWFLGIAFLAMFIMFNIVANQRDNARTASVTTDGAVITVRCLEPKK